MLGPWRGEQLAADTALVVTELATNAVLHARQPFSVSLALAPDTIRISVGDTLPLGLPGEEQELAATPGHGLGVIAALATRWGVETAPTGKPSGPSCPSRTRACLPLPPPPDRLGERCRRDRATAPCAPTPPWPPPLSRPGSSAPTPSRTSRVAPGISPASALALPTGKNGSAAPCTTSVGAVISGSRWRQRGVQSSLENTVLSRPLRADAGCGPQRSRTPAAWARASAASNCGEPESTRAAATAPSRIDVRSVQSTAVRCRSRP